MKIENNRKQKLISILALANQLHSEIYQLQNSGDVDDFECSQYTMAADALRDDLWTFAESLEVIDENEVR